MKSFQEMDPEVVQKLLEGHENVLKPEAEKEQAFFRHVTCPNCQSLAHDVLINARNPFTPGQMLPNKIMRCLSCRAEFDPYSRFISKAPPTT